MKILIFVLISVCTICELSAQEFYMYIGGQKHYLNVAQDRMIVKLEHDTVNIGNTISMYSTNISETDQRGIMIVEFQEKNTVNNNFELIDSWKKQGVISFFSPIYVDEVGNNLSALTDQVIIRLKDNSDYSILQKSAIANSLEILRQSDFDEKTYILVNHSDKQNALQISNALYETGLFDYVEPNFILFINYSTNDTYFPQQWGLNNTGQYGGASGIDINAPEAWTITTGSPNIRIAILDSGTDLTHPDLINNLLPGFDATGGSNGGNQSGVGHGTACAGIAAAQGNNSIGITGVAYNCGILPIHMGSSPLSDRVASGLNWATQNNANVVSMSFTTGETNAINLELAEATAANCVLVAATGNSNLSTIGYPASHLNVIAVGAISPCGQRKSPTSCDGETTWGSNYGTALDVVAPGVLIPTTDIQGIAGYNPNLPIHTNNGGNKITNDYADLDYTVWFNGTSAACPHVAGIAALVLSVNPCLTQQEVRNIIEMSCEKVGSYCYSTTAGRPNGTWNNQTGYGLVNAYKAVQYAHSTTITNFENISGSPYGTLSNQYAWQVSSSCGLAAGNYLVKRREIRATVSYPHTLSPVIVGAANGLSAASPNNGRQYIGTVSASETSATVNTYIYEVYSIAGQYLGWYPTTATNVRFNFKVLSALDTDLHLQNQNITTTASHAAIKSITAEDFTIQSGANVTLRAGEQTVLKHGFYAVDGSTFRAYIEPFFTCEQFPAMVAPQNDNYQEAPDYVIKNYEVENTPLPN